MAMKKCKECGKEVSTSAKLCPHCGKKYPTGGLTLPAKIFLIIVALIALGKMVSNKGGSSTPNNTATRTATTSSSLKEIPSQVSREAKSENWSYNDSSDKMGRGNIKHASTEVDPIGWTVLGLI